MITPISRVRLLGGVLVLAAFGLGVTVGWMSHRTEERGTRVVITATDEIPNELTRLGLTPEQLPQVRAVLRAGRERVMRVVEDFDPRFQAATDSTDTEIRAILSDVQRVAFDSARKANGPPLRRIRRPDSGGATR